MAAPNLLNSITDASDTDRECVVVTGSHGGLYAAYLASKAGIRACVFNDAGRGLDDAGIAGMMALGDVDGQSGGMAAAAVDCLTARIGDAADMMAGGLISAANGPALALGVTEGMACVNAAALLENAAAPTGHLPAVEEARRVIDRPGRPWVILVDSASLVKPDDAGQIVVTGSHGGLIGGDPARAIKADVLIAVYNDAGGGKDNAGVARLPALDARGIAGLTVAHTSARIGDARSMWDGGVISHANERASGLGAAPGMMLKAYLETV
ncbi:MAG: hypothetical protein VW268_10735 [Rhodospirillaceae bacterium]